MLHIGLPGFGKGIQSLPAFPQAESQVKEMDSHLLLLLSFLNISEQLPLAAAILLSEKRPHYVILP